MDFQGVVINVVDLDRSMAFYREVFGFTLLTEKEQLAVLNAPDSDRAQVLVLRALGTSPMGGARHVGLRSFVLEVDSADQLERIAAGLEARKALLHRREHSDWTAVVGRDPDGVAATVTWHPGGMGTTEESWKTLDDFLYGIGE
jgi:lactoylglutathione lyase